MKRLFACIIISLSISAGCSLTPYKDLSKEEKLSRAKLNILTYYKINELSNSAINNYVNAFRLENSNIYEGGREPFDNMHFTNNSLDSIEVSFQLHNTNTKYVKSVNGQPISSTGLYFVINETGSLKYCVGYVYYSRNPKHILLTGANRNLLKNKIK